MAAPPFHLPLLLAFLLLSTAAAAHSQYGHLQHYGHGPHHHHHHHHHRSPSTMTATARLDTAPSVHQNRMESELEETHQSLRVLNPFFATVAAQAPSGEDAMAAMGAAADAGDTTRLDLPSPPPSLPAAGDLMPSLAPPQPQAEEAGAGSSESEAAAPPPVVDEPYRDAASTPRPPPVVDEPYRDAASTPPSPPPVVDEPYRDAASPPPPPTVVDEPCRDATSPPPPPPIVDEPYREREVTSPPPPVHDDAARVVSSGTGDDLGLQQIAKVLASLGYNEMASSATLLADTASVTAWPGAITVFAAPDVFLKHSCPECSRRSLLLAHMALGYFPYAELAAAPARQLPSASVGFCLDVAAQPQRGPFSVHHASLGLYVNGVMVSEPNLHDDGRYVVHGLHGFIPPLSRASCVEDDAHAHHHHQVHLHHYRRHHHLSARSAATSGAIAASVVRIMIREAISRLRDSGFGFVALAMRVKFAELEKLSNLTVFALDDQVIFTGGGHGYVSAVRFHIVPGHRLTRAYLLRLRPGTVLPTLAGDDEKLVITLGAGSATDEVRINYIPVKEPDVVINSRVAVHGIYLPFPRLHLANLAASVAVASDLQTNDSCGVGGAQGYDDGESVQGKSSASAVMCSPPADKPAPTTMTLPLPRRYSAASAARPRHPAFSGRHSHGFRVSNKIGHGTGRAATTGGRHGATSAAAAVGLLGLGLAALAINQGRRERRRKQRQLRQAKVLRRKSSACSLVPIVAPEMDPYDGQHIFTGAEEKNGTITRTFVSLAELQARQAPKRLLASYKTLDNTLMGFKKRSPAKKMV
ncbi:hypothetical protein SORBI_3001G152400 [Sorghum bicolor]|uniref:FAS1 domain-containing protein n=1 Tax=Sorghum bicolor TaxID=4558 RepID=C5WR36_SORBI|nr:hypothetical protein SORBI_3001G152400 [Sorghum bicolor]